MGFIPSCDHKEDAIRSLSEIYAVSIEKIDGVLRTPEVKEIAKVYSQIDSPWFHFLVCHLLKSNPRTDISHAYYYHSTSYGGCSSWFDEGLLGSAQGVGRFLDKIIEWLLQTNGFPQRKQQWESYSFVAGTKAPQPRVWPVRMEYLHRCQF